MIVMVTKMTMTTMTTNIGHHRWRMMMMLMMMVMVMAIFQYWTPQVAYDDGETVSERIIFRYLEGDLYMEA